MGEWFAVQVRAGREQLAATHLGIRGYEVFLPCYRERRRWSDRVKTIDCALFAGYVFCRLQTGLAAKVVTTPGVIQILSDATGPIPIPSHEIEAIQRIVQTRLAVEPWTLVQVGQVVRLEQGPLSGVNGIVLTTTNRHRLVVSISLLQRAVAVEVEADWISIPLGALVEDPVWRS
jgi:transcriptional antiterminator NusG